MRNFYFILSVLFFLSSDLLFAEQTPFRFDTYERINPFADPIKPIKPKKTPVPNAKKIESKTTSKTTRKATKKGKQKVRKASRKTSPRREKASTTESARSVPFVPDKPLPVQVRSEPAPPKPEDKAEAPKGDVAKKAPVKSEVVDLKDLHSSSSYTPPSPGSGKNLQMFFDLVLSYRPESDSAFRFDNYHTALLIDYIPHPGFQFSMGFAPPDSTPRYYQIQADINPTVQVRAGRIWIPFDQMNPHNTFGGIYNTTPLRGPNQDAFLPDIWTDLGLAARIAVVDRSNFRMYQHFYIVNGFHEGGTDPLGESTTYPEFAGISVDEEKNTDKAMGTRTELSFGRILNVGFSAYTGRYSDKAKPSARILMLGTDVQLQLSRLLRFRGGYALMRVGLPEGTTRTTFLRGGLYGDLAWRFAPKWEFSLKGGLLQNDDGVLDQNDRTLVGARFNFRPNPVTTISFEHHQDIRDAPGKINRSYTALRVSLML